MRTSSILHALTVFLLPSLSVAQGTIIPPACLPHPCRVGRPCPPCHPGGPSVEKLSSRVTADLTNGVFRFEVTETFVNRGAGLGEADYVFPLPGGAAFQDLRLSINGELVAGETLSAERARSIYEQIVRQQRDPALVEWMGQGMLRARIFPIAPGEEKKVVVRFQMVAKREGDAIRLDYFRGRSRSIEGRELSDTRDGAPAVSFVLNYTADDRYGNAYSPTHTVSVRRDGSRRRVSLTGSAGDVTLLIPVRERDDAAISVLAHAPRGEDGFALITLSPPAVTPPATPRDVTLVLDVSGSMSGEKIRQARAAGLQVLGTLKASDRFRLIDFSTDVRTFRDEFVPATRGNISAASSYLESLDASGSTNISAALDAALEGTVPSGRLGLVLFVTDGAPTVGERNPEAIAARVARRRGARRLFSFGVGADLNAALVERLAVEGRGTAHFVRPDESVERAVSVVASRLASPVVTDIRVTASGVRLTRRHPSSTVDLFAGQDLVLLTRYEGSGGAILRFDGNTARGPVSWTSRVAFPRDSRENSFVARLWATQRVGYLSAEKRRVGGSREIDAEIRELGEKYAIPTEFTSYLVLEPGVVTTGVIARGVAAPPPVAENQRRFEAARAAAEQRSATNLAAADAAGTRMLDESVQRRIGPRVFTLEAGRWTDRRDSAARRVFRIRSFSPAWFRLVEEIPELREILALGEKVTVSGKTVTIETGDTGLDSLGAGDLHVIRNGWQ